MEYLTYKEILCNDTGETFRVGDTVTIHLKNGGGFGGCKIVKLTDSGFRFNQGIGRDKSVQYKDIEKIY